MTKKLYIVFTLDTGKKHNFTLPSPVSDLSKATAQAFADEVVANKGFVVNGAYPTAVSEMYIHQEEDVALV